MSLSERELPDGLVQHKQTPEFSDANFPEALGRDHSTKAGVWGVLNVTAGAVIFRDKALRETREVRAGETQVILPGSIHSAEPTYDARFFVQFFRAPEDIADTPSEIAEAG